MKQAKPKNDNAVADGAYWKEAAEYFRYRHLKLGRLILRKDRSPLIEVEVYILICRSDKEGDSYSRERTLRIPVDLPVEQMIFCILNAVKN